MPRFWRESKIDKAWEFARAARVKMRLLVQAEQEQVCEAYACVVDPLRDAYERTGNPGFALLALRPLQPMTASRSGRILQYTHAPGWAVQALMRAIDGGYPALVKEAEQFWLATEKDTTRDLYERLDRFSEREIRRVLQRWFPTEGRAR